MRGARWLAFALPLALGLWALGVSTESHGAQPPTAVAALPGGPLDAGADAAAPPAHPPVPPPPYTLVEAGWDRPIRILPAA